MGKRGVSPIIATVLLIVLVIAIALIIFTVFRGMTKEAITKFRGQNVEIICEEVSFDAEISSNFLTISNGNIPVFSFNIEVTSLSGYDTYPINEIVNNWPSTGLNPGGRFSGSTNINLENVNKIVLYPVLLGTTQNGEQKTYACPNGVNIHI